MEFGPARLCRQASKDQHIDIESRSVERNVFAFGGDEAVVNIVQRLAQVPYTVTQIAERGLVRGITPKQPRQFLARPSEIRAKDEIGQQDPLPLSR